VSDDDKERNINFGCAVWVFFGFLIGALWNVNSTLHKIDQRLVMSNCLYEAAHGVICSEAKHGRK
jgi:hypothetical protein